MNQRLERWRARRAEHLAALPWLVTDAAGPRTVRYVGDELLAVDEHYDDARSAVSAQGKSAADLIEDEPLPGVRRIRARGLDPLRAARRVRERAGDVQVGPNHVLLGTPHWQGGPFGRPVVSAAATLAVPGAQAPVRVAVMDTGVWSDSPLPVSRYTVGASDYETNTDADGDSVIDSDVGHANFIAGVVLQGTSQARVRIVKVLDSFGVGTELDLAQKVATLDDTDILNLSLGGYTADDQPPVLLRWALNRFLLGRDRLVVAAAGNDGQAGPPFWPAAFAGAGVAWKDQVIAVAAHDGTAVCQWSNTGAWVSVAAPGADVVSTYINHPEFTTGWAAWSGTSFATPHVVAAIAEAAHTGGVVAAAKQVLSGTAVSFAGYPAIS
ncbi:S8 family peptidase [Dactylosporangium matsuzakiense]|uniref:S8 family peptidase n=1 Tax=Dactylosporangium matsuzakiense TaxID=53360 RepID=UPI0021C25A52|nr:S8 family serine peptidase [Dactylosporangium matsuzakiense]UWZ41004.1 S8 family serine peptidase [Dactylosporangium matsuzakiense]